MSSFEISSTANNETGSNKILLWAGVFATIVFMGTVVDSCKTSFYIFDPVHLQVLCQKSLATYGNATHLVIEDLISTLATQHPSFAINTNFALPSNSSSTAFVPNEAAWMFNNAGGAMGTMFIIHASITEYLIIFGTPLGNEGHTGRNTADNYFTILKGEQWAAKEGAMEKEIYRPGDQNYTPRGVVKQYAFQGFALELSQGWITLMLPFGYADSMTSTLDFPTMLKTTYLTGRAMLKNLVHGKI